MVENGWKLLKFEKRLKIIENGLQCVKRDEISWNQVKMVENGCNLKRVEHSWNASKRLKMGGNGWNWVKKNE